MYKQPSHTWHSDTIASMEEKTYNELLYIIKDCLEAAEAGKDSNPKVGEYLDTMHYASMELKKRSNKNG